MRFLFVEEPFTIIWINVYFRLVTLICPVAFVTRNARKNLSQERVRIFNRCIVTNVPMLILNASWRHILTLTLSKWIPSKAGVIKENVSLTGLISLTTNMLIGLYLSISKPFIIPLGFTATATICLLMILKKCMRGYVLCQQLSWQNFSFYFVLYLVIRPKGFQYMNYYIGSLAFYIILSFSRNL